MAAPAPAPAAAAAAAVKHPPFSWDEPGKKVLLETGMTIIPAYVAGGVSTPSRMFNKSSQSVPTDFRTLSTQLQKNAAAFPFLQGIDFADTAGSVWAVNRVQAKYNDDDDLLHAQQRV